MPENLLAQHRAPYSQEGPHWAGGEHRCLWWLLVDRSLSPTYPQAGPSGLTYLFMSPVYSERCSNFLSMKSCISYSFFSPPYNIHTFNLPWLPRLLTLYGFFVPLFQEFLFSPWQYLAQNENSVGTLTDWHIFSFLHLTAAVQPVRVGEGRKGRI